MNRRSTFRYARLSSIPLAAALFVSALPACHGEKALPAMPTVSDPRLQATLTSIAYQMRDCSIPGGAIAVVENGALTESVGFGVKDDVSGQPVLATTRFNSGGLTKVLVGATALRLTEEGSLDLTKPVTAYVPLTLAAGFDPSGITASDLLTQTSGLPDVDVEELGGPVGQGQLAAWFASQPAQPLWSPAGQVWDYSQRGYAVAAWVIETAASQSIDQAVSSRIFAQAGMTSATYDPSVVLAGDYAPGHDIDPASGSIADTEVPGAYDGQVFRATDGVYATTADYASFVATLFAGGKTMLTPASVSALETGHVADELYPGDEYSYGLYVHEGYKGLHLLRTAGTMRGYATALYLVPDRQFAVVVFFDADNPSGQCGAGAAAEAAINQFLDLENVPGPDWATPPSAWTPFVGHYADPYGIGDVTVSLDGSQLTATASGFGTVPLTQQSAMAFTAVMNGHSGTITFAPGASGAATYLVTRLGVGVRTP